MSNKEVYLPLITPLDNDGNVCERSVASLMAYAINHVDGFVPCLTSGEGWQLSQHQWKDMVTYCVENAAGKPVIAGIERPTTDEVITFADTARQLGANGIICTAPFKPELSQHDIHEHFSRVHEATPLELFIYFESTLCNNKWDIKTLLSLCLLPRVKGIKESCGENKLAPHLRNIRRMGVKVYQGWEDKLLDYDTDGSMVSFCNLNPQLCSTVTRERGIKANETLMIQCQESGIFELDWYRHMKMDLYRRGIIHTHHTVSSVLEGSHDNTETAVPA